MWLGSLNENMAGLPVYGLVACIWLGCVYMAGLPLFG